MRAIKKADQGPAHKSIAFDRPNNRRGELEIIGECSRIRDMLARCETVALTQCTVLIFGETGTGKELVAGMIHNLSPRSHNAFIRVNCAAIPLGLLESELFGHERGAFTGALAQRISRFELADKGTLFLDEVGDIPPELQPKLLRILQEQEFERLGSSRTIQTDVRLVAATRRRLCRSVCVAIPPRISGTRSRAMISAGVVPRASSQRRKSVCELVWSSLSAQLLDLRQPGTLSEKVGGTERRA